jgi:hypothetical protein
MRTALRPFAAAAVLSVLLIGAACSSGHASEQTSLTALCTKLGGTFKEDTDQHELFTSDEGDCGTYTVYLFAGKSQRDSWLSAARAFGGNFAVGPDWIIATDNPADAATARQKLGGTN